MPPFLLFFGIIATIAGVSQSIIDIGRGCEPEPLVNGGESVIYSNCTKAS
jgi:hypothetical protein